MMQLINRLLEGKTIAIIALAYTIFVTVIMLLPVSVDSGVTIPYLDKLVHAFIYIVFVLIWSIYVFKTRREKFTTILLISIALFIYGIVIEFLQGNFVANRSQDFWDIVANSTGIIIGVIVFYKLKNTFLFKI